MKTRLHPPQGAHPQVRGRVRAHPRPQHPLHQADRHGHGPRAHGRQPHLGLHPGQDRLLPHAGLQVGALPPAPHLADAAWRVPVQHQGPDRWRLGALPARRGLLVHDGRCHCGPGADRSGRLAAARVRMDLDAQAHHPGKRLRAFFLFPFSYEPHIYWRKRGKRTNYRNLSGEESKKHNPIPYDLLDLHPSTRRPPSPCPSPSCGGRCWTRSMRATATA